MRYEADHKKKTHRRIVASASRQLRAKGLNGPGIAKLMKASGLTHGGFYKHFRSRDELIAEAVEESLRDVRERFFLIAKQAPPGEGWKEIVKKHLSLEHCDRPDMGCPIAALAPDIGRSSAAVRKLIAANMKNHREKVLPFMPGRNRQEQERNFMIIVTAMTGAVSVARIMPDAADKQKILNAVRDHLLASF